MSLSKKMKLSRLLEIIYNANLYSIFHFFIKIFNSIDIKLPRSRITDIYNYYRWRKRKLDFPELIDGHNRWLGLQSCSYRWSSSRNDYYHNWEINGGLVFGDGPCNSSNKFSYSRLIDAPSQNSFLYKTALILQRREINRWYGNTLITVSAQRACDRLSFVVHTSLYIFGTKLQMELGMAFRCTECVMIDTTLALNFIPLIIPSPKR